MAENRNGAVRSKDRFLIQIPQNPNFIKIQEQQNPNLEQKVKAGGKNLKGFIIRSNTER